MSESSLKFPIISKGAITIGNESSLDLIMLTSKSALAEKEASKPNNIKNLMYFIHFPQSRPFV